MACEHVLKSLKKGRETLLTLLEAFVYDPLVDWAIGEDSGDLTAIGPATGAGDGNPDGANNAKDPAIAKKQMEREVTRDTLAIRFAEIKTDWLQNRSVESRMDV